MSGVCHQSIIPSYQSGPKRWDRLIIVFAPGILFASEIFGGAYAPVGPSGRTRRYIEIGRSSTITRTGRCFLSKDHLGMFYHDGGKLQYEVKVDNPNPVFAKALQQAIGGIRGEIRVALQYLFQAFGARGPKKYRDMLLETGTEELGHIEMLATAVALNLEGAPTEMEDAANDPIVFAKLGGMNVQHAISTCLAALPVDSSGASLSTAPTSTPRATSPPTCCPTSWPNRPAGCSPSNSIK